MIRLFAKRRTGYSLRRGGSTRSSSVLATCVKQRHHEPLHTRTSQYHQCRSFSYLWDVIQSGSFSQGNPVLDATTVEENGGKVNFNMVKPIHLTDAAKHVQKEAVEQLQTLEGKLTQKEFTESEILAEIDTLEIPSRNVLNMASIFAQIRPYDTAWNESTDEAATILTFPHLKSKALLGALQVMYATSGVNSKHLKRLIDMYEKNGVHLDSERISMLEDTREALNNIGSKFVVHSGNDSNIRSPPTKETLQNLYTAVGLKLHEAKLHRYSNAADFWVEGRTFTKDEVSGLIDEVARRATKALSQISPNRLDQLGEAEKNVVQFVTLDGSLSALSALSTALFGIVVKEDDKPQAWDKEVRLIHFSDQESGSHLGSLYLDAFRRPTKSSSTFMGPMVLHKKTLFMNLNCRPPVWDDMPNQIQLKDAVGLFHEWGHVLQFLLAHHDGKGTINGGSHVPLDVCEILPQFMEHWLFEEPILQTVAHLSFEGQRIPDETVAEIQEQRSTQKIYESLHRAFMGQLELELFSRSGENEEESLVALQRRIAEKYIDHQLPAKSDLAPMVELVSSNLGGKQVAQYRYLLSEVISAQLFRAFKDADISDQNQMKQMGERFKCLLLTPGASFEVKTAVKALTGGEIAPQSYFEMYKI